MVDTYANVMRIDLVHQASRRAREEQAVAISVPAVRVREPERASGARMVRGERKGENRDPARPRSISDAEQSLQDHARERGGSADLSARIRAERTQ